MTSRSHEIPTRPFGRTGEQVSIIGLGGFHLGLPATDAEATRLVHAAIDAGITFLDNAWDYNDGVSEKRMGKAIADRRAQVFLMTKVCTHGRDGKVAMGQLEDSLKRLRTDHLDLWQIHEVVFDDEPARHFARGGVVEALDRARQQGKVRYVGFTGHKSPELHLEMLGRDFDWDSCQLPLNCFDGTFRSFERNVLPELNRRGIAPIGMKSMGGDGRAVKAKVVSAQDALTYALSLPVATVVSGIDSMRVLKQNLAVARGFTPLSASGMQAIRKRVAAQAVHGRFELYKISAAFEGEETRRVHGLPSQGEMAI
ncbi:MAG TPA: aldo/keto reductase [Vicinamibacterales bacterium]|nr:aldo/keto reductase [Vicinamibacterales bacterium]